MKQEDIVPFEIAKKLKEKGFPQRPDYFNYSSYYDWDGLRKIHSLSNASVWFDPNISRDNIYFAPTISQVLKWLRKEKKIHICIDFDKDMNWYFQIAIYSSTDIAADGDGYNEYEESALAGIEYVLDYLI
jgi:hypothetical protein